MTAEMGAQNEGTDLKQPASVFCSTRKGIIYKPHSTSQSFPSEGVRLWPQRAPQDASVGEPKEAVRG